MGDWRQNPNKPNKTRTNPLPPNLADFQSCMSQDHVDRRGRAIFIKGRKSAVWMTEIMPKKADEMVNRRKNRCHWRGGVTNPGNRRLKEKSTECEENGEKIILSWVWWTVHSVSCPSENPEGFWYPNLRLDFQHYFPGIPGLPPWQLPWMAQQQWLDMKQLQTKFCHYLQLPPAPGCCSCQMRQEKVGFTSCSCQWVTPAPKSTFSEDLGLLMGDTPYENHLKIRPDLFESSWSGSYWICVIWRLV